MRILWLSPWMRPLARVYVEQLQAMGHECLLVTSDQHYEPAQPRDYERVLDPRPKHLGTTPALLRTVGEARRWRPDVVIAELVWDPRWLLLARLAPLVHLVHDDRPHDASEQRPWWQRRLFDTIHTRATRIVAFSEHVACGLEGTHRLPAAVVPLTSDATEEELPSPVPLPAARRKDFLLYGRMSEYKNVTVALRAWREHLHSPAYRGDRMVLLGDGPLQLDPAELPPACQWDRGRYTYAELLPQLAAAKGSLVHYRQATQSGVQLLSLQLGVAPVISDRGGLAEFQPDGAPPLGADDVAGLAARLDALADPEIAAHAGAAGRKHYLARLGASRAASALESVLESAASSVQSRRMR